MADAAYINLESAGERRAFMQAQGRRLGLDLDRFAAIEAGVIDAAIMARLAESWERPLSAAELACFLSHHALWQRVLAERRPMLILEDDAVLSPRLGRSLPALLALRGGDIVNLEDFGRRRFLGRRPQPIPGTGLSLVRTFRDKAGAAAYILWPSGAAKLLARAERGAAPADAFLHGLAGLNAFQCEPALAIQAHIMVARGLDPGLATATSVQAPRARLKPTPANARFVARRLATQVRLVRQHLRRLGPGIYRRVDIDPADFT